MAQVTIHRRDAGIRIDDAGHEVQGLYVTYSTTTFPPRQLFVPGDKPTDAQIAAAVRDDVEVVAAERPTRMEI